MILRFQIWLYEKYLNWYYRNQDPTVCCCGDYVGSGNGICYHGGCRSMKEYTITSTLAEYKEKKNGKSIRNPVKS